MQVINIGHQTTKNLPATDVILQDEGQLGWVSRDREHVVKVQDFLAALEKKREGDLTIDGGKKITFQKERRNEEGIEFINLTTVIKMHEQWHELDDLLEDAYEEWNKDPAAVQYKGVTERYSDVEDRLLAPMAGSPHVVDGGSTYQVHSDKMSVFKQMKPAIANVKARKGNEKINDQNAIEILQAEGWFKEKLTFRDPAELAKDYLKYGRNPVWAAPESQLAVRPYKKGGLAQNDIEAEIWQSYTSISPSISDKHEIGDIRNNIVLCGLFNDITLALLAKDNVIAAKQGRGFGGFSDAKPTAPMAPIAITVAEARKLGIWKEGVGVNVMVEASVDDKVIGRLSTAEGIHETMMDVGPVDGYIQQLTANNHMKAGTVIGSGTISNKHCWKDPNKNAQGGVLCIREAVAQRYLQDAKKAGAKIEGLAMGVVPEVQDLYRPTVSFLKSGQKVTMSAKDSKGRDVFGKIESAFIEPEQLKAAQKEVDTNVQNRVAEFDALRVSLGLVA